MPRYCVNATLTMAAWVWVEADSEAEALDEAHSMDADLFAYDHGTAQIDFNVEPAVEGES